MTRKLAVTVFAMSLTLVGCGSSSTTKVDANPDTKVVVPDSGTKLDVVASNPDTLSLSDTRTADVVTSTPDVSTDIAVSDQRQPDQTTTDTTVVPPTDARDSGTTDRAPDGTPPDSVSDVPQSDASDATADEAGGEAG